MPDAANGKQPRRSFTAAEEASGAAIREAFMRHLDEQQHWAGFVAETAGAEGPRQAPPRTRGKR
jgi:hypothetical protein